MEEGGDILQHITYMTSLAEQLGEMKEILSKKFATAVLGSLPESYDNFLSSLNVRNADELDWENMKSLLIEEYMKRSDKSKKNEFDNTLFTKKGRHFNHGRSVPRGGRRGGARGGRTLNFGTNKEQYKFRETRCIKCNPNGHIVRNCPFNNRNFGRAEASNVAEIEGIALISSTTSGLNEWFIDSAATKHMTND